jgi:hypothetical protein
MNRFIRRAIRNSKQNSEFYIRKRVEIEEQAEQPKKEKGKK